MKAKILDIFQSIQGEGKYAGVKQVFVRFFECNMHCVWCDTPASIGDTTRNYQEMDLEKTVKKIDELWDEDHSVSLTGGEPLLQKDFIKQLLPVLKKARQPAYLETNGVLPAALSEIIDQIDFIAMDIKLPSSTQCREYWCEHEEFLKIVCDYPNVDTFIKAVVSSETRKADIEKAVDLVSRIAPDMLFILQPNTFQLKNGVMLKCLEFHDYSLRYLRNSRIMPQMHKFMKLK